MKKYMMVGCDLHDKNMLVMMAVGKGKPVPWTVPNTTQGRKRLFEELKKRAGGARIVMAYEASSLGFNLRDETQEAGIACHILAPTKMPSTPHQRKRKTDIRDAEKILEMLRGHLLAGNALPSIWIPDEQTRDERELVRARLEVGKKVGSVKTQVRCLLKRSGMIKARPEVNAWTKKDCSWLEKQCEEKSMWGNGTRQALKSLLRQKASLEGEIRILNEEVETLSKKQRYAGPVEAVRREAGVGLLTAMVYLTELGDLSRFANRRKVAAFLGIVPSSHESGDASERKGHITRQGPWRIRKVLCQATWARIRCDQEASERYARLVGRNPRQKKIAVVAMMRQLSIRM